MKLRNKKNGKVLECKNIEFTQCKALGTECSSYVPCVNSLAELNEDWEDYTPKEPLIKDEKIRKAVRAWAEALYLRGAIFDFNDETMMLRGEKLKAYISFDGLDFCEFKHITAEYHSIAELCGEGEE